MILGLATLFLWLRSNANTHDLMASRGASPSRNPHKMFTATGLLYRVVATKWTSRIHLFFVPLRFIHNPMTNHTTPPSPTAPINFSGWSVTKRDGRREPWSMAKLMTFIERICHGSEADGLKPLRGVSASEVFDLASRYFTDGIKTTDIVKQIKEAASDLISLDNPEYDKVAGRAVWFNVRKLAFGSFTPPPLYNIICDNVAAGVYDPLLLEAYTEQEWKTIDGFINHQRDDLFRLAGAEQMVQKYLVRDKRTRRIYETFQHAYILSASVFFANYPAKKRLALVKAQYDDLSLMAVSLPSPVMGKLRTPQRQFSSCAKIEVGDDLDSISSSYEHINAAAAAGTGLGINIGHLRASGQAVRQGDTITTGPMTFLQAQTKVMEAVSKGGMRKSSATINFPMMHLDYETLIQLKNERGADVNRNRTADYATGINKVFLNRFLNNEPMSFFSPEQVPELWDAFYSADVKLFEKLYIEAENNPHISSHRIPAQDAFASFCTERGDTHRIYATFMDNINRQTPFYEPITMTNLCVEIALPTTAIRDEAQRMDPGSVATDLLKKIEAASVVDAATGDDWKKSLLHHATTKRHPYAAWRPAQTQALVDDVAGRIGLDAVKSLGVPMDDDGRVVYALRGRSVNLKEPMIALCTLSAINMGQLTPLCAMDPESSASSNQDRRLWRTCDLLVRSLNELLDYQTYSSEAARRHTMRYRPLGIGIIDFAHFLAKGRLRWGSPEALFEVDRIMDRISYYLIRASVDLAKERGSIPVKTRYHEGLFPKDWSLLTLKSGYVSDMPWDQLSLDARRYGIRNATLMAGMPSETSSTISNAVNAFHPPMEMMTVKSSRDVTVKQIVPGFSKIGPWYETRFEVSVPDYLVTTAFIQKHMDQAMSLETSYKPDIDGKVLMSDIMADMLLAHQLGHKTLYYHNVQSLDDVQGENDDACAGGACKI